jgi:hypothetical protein
MLLTASSLLLDQKCIAKSAQNVMAEAGCSKWLQTHQDCQSDPTWIVKRVTRRSPLHFARSLSLTNDTGLLYSDPIWIVRKDSPEILSHKASHSHN